MLKFLKSLFRRKSENRLVWHTSHFSDAYWVNDGMQDERVVYFCQISECGRRRAYGFGVNNTIHNHYLTCVAPWVQHLMDWDGDDYFVPCHLSDKALKHEMSKPKETPPWMKDVKPKVKKDGNVIYFPSKNS